MFRLICNLFSFVVDLFEAAVVLFTIIHIRSVAINEVNYFKKTNFQPAKIGSILKAFPLHFGWYPINNFFRPINTFLSAFKIIERTRDGFRCESGTWIIAKSQSLFSKRIMCNENNVAHRTQCEWSRWYSLWAYDKSYNKSLKVAVIIQILSRQV